MSFRTNTLYRDRLEITNVNTKNRPGMGVAISTLINPLPHIHTDNDGSPVLTIRQLSLFD